MRRSDGEQIVAGRPGYSIWGNDQTFALKYPLGATRVEWEAVDGWFKTWSDDTVTFTLKPEWMARRSVLFRFGIRLGRALDDRSGLKVDAAAFGLSAEQLAATMNAELAARLGTPPVDAETTVHLAEQGPLRKWSRRYTAACVAVMLVVIVIARLIH